MYECAQSAITFNNLNLPTYDIHSKQSRDQVLVNIHTLAQSFITISTKHIQKAKSQNDRINELKQRILKCRDRIQQFESTNQALIFVSPSQYPKKYKFDPEKNVSIFRDYLVKTKVNKLDMNAHYIVKHEIQKLGEESKLKLSELNKFVIFLMGQLQGKKRTAFERSLHPSRRKTQTLGHIPQNLQYIDSLIVFNSHINPYRRYEITSNIFEVQQQQQRKKKQLQDIEKNQIIIDRELANYSKPEFQQGSNKFVPQEKELQMPTFDLDLELDGIVRYDLSTEIDFMNEFADFDNVRKKNVVTDPYAGMSKKDSSQSSQSMSSSTTLSQSTSQYNINSSSQMLPPPPSLNATSVMQNNLPPPPPMLPGLPPPPGLKNLPAPPAGLLPPPPPLGMMPPPLSKLPPPPTMLPPPPMLSMPAASAKGTGRGALLSQLQNPNPMARLKKVKTVEKGGIKPEKTSKTTGQNNAEENNGDGEPMPAEKPRQLTFMQALQAKIASRFKIIHGDQEDDDD